MSKKNEKSVEFQILESEILNELKDDEKAKEVAKCILSFGEDEVLLGVVMAGLITLLDASERDMRMFLITMKLLKAKSPFLREGILSCLANMIVNKAEKEVNNDEEE